MPELSNYQDILDIEPQDLTAIAENEAKSFAQINTNQIRNIFSEIVKMRTEFDVSNKFESIRKDFFMLKPKLAYAAARQPDKMEAFKMTFDKLIYLVEKSKDQDKAMESFFDFSEAVVAYHKYYEKKQK